jgi:hypothetical protein
VALHAIGLPFASGNASVVVRVASISLLVGAIVWAVRRTRDDETLWRGAVVVMAAYLYLTPWSFYWYAVGLVALVSAVPRNKLTYPLLAFSGTQLTLVRFRPPLAAWTAQTVLRYGLPVLPMGIRCRADRVVRRGSGRVSFPVPSPHPISQRAPAAE